MIDYVEHLKMCIAEAGYDPAAVRITPEGTVQIVVVPDLDIPWVPVGVADKAFRLVGGEDLYIQWGEVPAGTVPA